MNEKGISGIYLYFVMYLCGIINQSIYTYVYINIYIYIHKTNILYHTSIYVCVLLDNHVETQGKD